MNNVLLSPIRLDELEKLVQASVERALLSQGSSSNVRVQPTEQLLTVEQAADFLRLSIQTIYTKVSSKPPANCIL